MRCRTSRISSMTGSFGGGFIGPSEQLQRRDQRGHEQAQQRVHLPYVAKLVRVRQVPSWSVGLNDFDETTVETGDLPDRVIDSLGQGGSVRVIGACDDPGMVRVGRVESMIVPAVECQNG